MEGRNSVGRRISLLNDSSDVADSAEYCQLQARNHSTTSSCSSTPSLSPQTPPFLSRTSSSADSRALSTPSPLTPLHEATFDLAHSRSNSNNTTSRQSPAVAAQNKAHVQQYFLARPSSQTPAKMDPDPNNVASLYPPIPDGAMQAYHPMPMPGQLLPQQQMQMSIPMGMGGLPMQQQQPLQPTTHRASTSPSSEPSRVSAHSATSNAKTQPKKNQYPCPMAKQFDCTDFFTTSGHAARHAKKHTGKKDAFCPECNKAFTRKDNMEQHRRTHQNGRPTARSTASTTTDDAKVKKSTKQPSKKAIKPEPQLEAAVEQQLADQQQQQQQHLADSQMLAATLVPAQQNIIPQQHLIESELMIPMAGGGPYFVGSGQDMIPVSSLPMVMSDLNGRPGLQRSSYGLSSLEYAAPMAPMTVSEDALHYSYPSPGLSNGLNSLALAASEHRRLSEEKNSQSPRSQPEEPFPSQETPSEQMT